MNALYANNGSSNTATGFNALQDNTTASNNTASGAWTLAHNTTAGNNTATGAYALTANTTASGNTASGAYALNANTTGASNTADGNGALKVNSVGANNTAIGKNALIANTTGGSNIALGSSAGSALTTGNNNIDIGNVGAAGESAAIRIGTAGAQTATFIAGIKGIPVTGAQVTVSSTGQLGIRASSERFKQDIKAMAESSETIYALDPVTFRYKPELDPQATLQFGLVAEEVAKADPALVERDDEGKPYAVRYEAVDAMLLNEFLKEHRTVAEQARVNQEQETTIQKQETTIAELNSAVAEQQQQIATLMSQMQMVSALMTTSDDTPHLAATAP